MTFRTLIRRSLRFHARSHLGVTLGAAVGSAALIGALVVGDSVKESLREMALARMGQIQLALPGGDRLFRMQLADEVRNDLPSVPVAGAFIFNGIVSTADGSARVNRAQVCGVDEHFWAFGNSTPAFGNIPEGKVVINQPLAKQLGVAVGDTIVLRIPKPAALGREFIVSSKSDSSRAVQLNVLAIASAGEFGGFSLQAGQSVPLNAFISLGQMQTLLGEPGRVNLMLVGESTVPAVTSVLEKSWRLDDAQAGLYPFPNQSSLELKTARVFLDAPVVGAALAADADARPVLTYLANLLRSGADATPYSMVTAAGPPWTPSNMQDDEILVSPWLAEDLQVKSGDEISLVYFDPASGAHLVERTNTFRVRGMVPPELPWADRTLMPDFPGIEKAESASDWDAGFPLVNKIRPKDDEYWRTYRGTPKAFITLAAGQKLWGNRFGNVTSIRFAIPDGTMPGSYGDSLEKKILAGVEPAEVGLKVEPVRERALQAAAQSQDFGGLFIGFSFFLIIAALLLMAMLFQFGLEQRMTEVGTLLALGFKPAQVRWLLLGEGTALAFIGGIIGALGGLAYARAVLQGLATIWRDAVGTTTMNFHVTVETLATGLFASVIVSVVTLWLTLRRLIKRPARELLSGEIQDAKSGARARGSLYGGIALVLAAGLVGWALMKGDTADAESFFSAGSLLLVAGLCLVSGWLNRHQSTSQNLTLGSLGLRGCARRRKRSVATVAILACGCFLIVSIGVFRLDANQGADKRTSGTGGFALLGETTMPVVQDLNSKSGRDFFALNEDDLKGVSFVPFRVHQGDEASCLNLNGAPQPRLLGVNPELLEGRFTFAKLLSEHPAGWKSLEMSTADDSEIEIPAIGDANSIEWAMHKQVGDTIDYVDEHGQPFKVHIVGAVANSILQGSLIIEDGEFVRLFPSASGYETFLIDAPSNSVASVSAALSRAMQDVGLELTPAARRLDQFNAVQNTYLGTFQVLGGLGLLLGSVGLGIVVLRNVLERRGELAVLQAVGYQKHTVQKLLLVEHGALLALGLGIGVIAAAVAVLPSVLTPGAALPYRSLGLTLAAVLVNGFLWTWGATRLALRGNLLAALRNE